MSATFDRIADAFDGPGESMAAKVKPHLANNPTHAPSGTPSKPHVTSQENRRVWSENAEALADFAQARIFVRHDVYGVTPPDGKRFTAHELLTRETIVSHFQGQINIGAFLVSPENTCKCFIGDIDAHEDTSSPDLNLERVNLIVETLAEFNLFPLVCDSDGKGGFHVREFFKKPVPSEVAYWLGIFINDRLESAGLPKVEFFPKQPKVKNETPYGNWVRLPGRHHKRDNYTRVWKYGKWLDGIWAAKAIIEIAGDDADELIKAYNATRKEKEDRESSAQQAATENAAKASNAESNGRHDGDVIDETPGQYLDRCIAYAKKGLANIVRKIVAAGKGFRHDTILDDTNHLAEFVHSEWLTKEECLSALHGAADANGMGPGRYAEIDEMFRSAMARTTKHKQLGPRRRKSRESSKSASAPASANGNATPSGDGTGTPEPAKKANQTKPARPEVEITTQWHDVRDGSIAALQKDDRIYLRGDALATVWRSPTSTQCLSHKGWKRVE